MSGFISYRSMVDPSDRDFLGHVNVSRYFAACSDGICAIQSDLGLTALDMRTGRRISFAVVNAQSDFVKRRHAGDSIWLETTVEKIGTKSMAFRHTLYRAPDGERVFTTLFKSVLLDLKARRAREAPDDIRPKARRFMKESG